MKLKERQLRKSYYDYQKRNSGRRSRISLENAERDSDFVASLMQTDEDDSPRRNRIIRVLREVMENELTPRQKEIIQLRYFQNMKNREIAGQLGINISTVSRTRVRAEQRIRHVLRYCIPFLRSGED